jgi:TonB family protein
MIQVMTTVAIRSDWVGRVIDGRFPLLQWLGGSARSSVFLTEPQGSGSQKAAIKLIVASDEDAKAYMANWAPISTLTHPHLMNLLHSGRCELDKIGLFYAVTEYADEVLSEIIAERPLAPNEVKEMLVPVLDALFYLHGRGFVHGHLKPSNIMAVNNQLRLSVDSLEFAGEPGKHYSELSIYDAPEIADKRLTSAADVWSLGVTLIEALTQQPPVWDRLSDKEPDIPESIPMPYARIARECLRLDPGSRCTLSDVNKARLETVRSVPKPASKIDKAPLAAAPVTRIRPIAIIAAVAILFAVVAFAYLQSHKTVPSTSAVHQQPVPAASVAPASVRRAQPAKRVTEKVPEPSQSRAQTSNGANAAMVKRVLPDVPQTASATIHGTVRVRIRVAVDAAGDVSNAALESAGPSRYFANLALDAARGWKFKPAQAGGQAAGGVWMLEFDFRQAGTDVTSTEVSP